MARQKKNKRKEDKASPDLTPMIDVTFQLLIFFILCTRFKVEERDHQVQLPKDEGLESTQSIPKEQIQIRCNWKQEQLINSYDVAIGDRGRLPVENSTASLNDLVIFPNDGNAAIGQKKALYAQIFENLVRATETYISRAGAERIEKMEISFAVNAMQGAQSGTAPWMFVSLAIDAAAQINKNRAAANLEPLTVTFKFADALGKYAER